MLRKVCLLLTLAPAALAAQGTARVDPRLLLARRVAERAAAGARALAGPAPFGALAPASVEADGSIWLRTLARVGPGGEAGLAAAGARIGARVGDVVTALVPAGALERAAAIPGLVYLEAAQELHGAVDPLPEAPAAAPERATRAIGAARAPRPIRAARPISPALRAPQNDVGADAVDVSPLRQREGDTFLGLAGQGVVVGIFDSGLDLSHGDFRGAYDTRVRWAWDQTTAGSPPGQVGAGSYDYGFECSRQQVAGGACPMRDRVGHGTHIAGTAAGTGAATGKNMPAYRFTGVAPRADLIVVKGGDGSFTSDRLVDGVAYIFERAREIGEPAVVNLSMATQDGPHDGSTNFERALDALAGPGRIIAAAAGNEAVNGNESPAFVRAPVHAGGRLTSGARSAVDLVVPSYTPAPGASNDAALLELWYDGRDSLTVTVTTPTGTSVRLATGDTALVTTPAGAVLADNASTGRNPNNGDREVVIALADLDASAPPASGRWHVDVEGAAIAGSGRWDLWLVGSTLKAPAQPSYLDGAAVRNERQVAAPGSTTRAITVAAWAGRHAWTTTGGAQQAYPFQERLGDIAFFSNPGPRRDGTLKPEIAAPGKVVLSSMSRDAGATWSALPAYVEADSAHAVLMGTSMATPFVTGAVALLLQLRPMLSPEDARAILTASAARDAFTSHPYTGEADASPNAQWGYGKLDVAAAVHSLGLPSGVLHVDLSTPPWGARPLGIAGARVELLRMRLEADSTEAQQVVRLGFDVAGSDTAAELLIVRDEDSNGVAGDLEPIVGRLPVRLTGSALHVTMPGPVVPAGETRDYLVLVRVGSAIPNGTSFSATYRSDDLVTRGTLSGVENRTAPGGPVPSPRRATTILAPGELVNITQNPVRSAPLIINYDSRPRAIHIYAPNGVRVRTLDGAALDDGRALWDLDNDRGYPVASGVYLLVLDTDAGAIVRKLLVAR